MKLRFVYNLIIHTMSVLMVGCVPVLNTTKTENKSFPSNFNNLHDSVNSADIKWKEYFNDTTLTALIETALKNNQELNITLQEIEISKNEVRSRKGEYLPYVGLKAGAGLEKDGHFTRVGAIERNLEIKPGEEFPEPFTDFIAGAYASWEIDVWKKLRNSKKAAVTRYLSSIEGKNFMITNLIAEISTSYYELLALDNQLEIIQQNIDIQANVLRIIKQQKEAARVTQLAVNRFEAQLLKTKSLQFEIRQNIVETENKLNFILGRFPQPIGRNKAGFSSVKIDSAHSGVPSQLLEKRADIRKAEMELIASRLDLKAAKANFYPGFKISAGTGFHAFRPSYLIMPESILYSLAGDMIVPLINRNAIKAEYYNANAKQIQAIFNYERTLLNAYVEVVNQLSLIDNFSRSYEAKSREVEYLVESITISESLFNSARADYMEVLLTQREALESKIELVEIKLKQMNAKVGIYEALGGGWN